MLPPPPASRNASYAYTLPRRSTSRYPSLHSLRPEGPRVEHEESDDFDVRLEMEEDFEGVGGERGLEETLEKLGFGAFGTDCLGKS